MDLFEQSKMPVWFDHFVRGPFHTLQMSVNNIVDQQARQENRFEQIDKVVGIQQSKLGELSKVTTSNSDILTTLKTENIKLSGQLKAADKRISQLSNDLKASLKDVKTLENLFMDMQVQVNAHIKADPLDNPDNCIIIVGLPIDTDGDLQTQCETMMDNLHLDDTPKCMKCVRLTSRKRGDPGLVKVALEGKKQKIEVLRAKKVLRNVDGYERIYINSSKGHVERIQEINTRKLLSMVPGGEKLKLASNGRLIDKNETKAPNLPKAGKRPRILSDEPNAVTTPTKVTSPPVRMAVKKPRPTTIPEGVLGSNTGRTSSDTAETPRRVIVQATKKQTQTIPEGNLIDMTDAIHDRTVPLTTNQPPNTVTDPTQPQSDATMVNTEDDVSAAIGAARNILDLDTGTYSLE